MTNSTENTEHLKQRVDMMNTNERKSLIKIYLRMDNKNNRIRKKNNTLI